MKWVSLVLGILFILFGWFILLLGRGITFTHGEYKEWDDAFFDTYYACCFMTDLSTAAPFFSIGAVCLFYTAWRFFRS
jgi:hypothetical protein